MSATAFPQKMGGWRFGIAAGVVVCLGLFFFAASPGEQPMTTGSQSLETSNIRGGHGLMTEVFHPGPKQPLNAPLGGKLVNLIASPKEADNILHVVSPALPSLTLTPRQLCDVELIINGGFSPLDSFMNQKTYDAVVNDLRLGSDYDNIVFPMPITLDVSNKFADTTKVGDQIAMRDPFFNLIGVLTVTDKWTPNKAIEAQKVFGTTDESHPAVDYLMNQAGPVYLGGSIKAVRLPQHFDFNEIRFTPAEVRSHMEKIGWSKFVAFQTRNPMHRAHIELTRMAANENNLGVLIHPVVGMTKPGDVDYTVRVRCYKAIVGSGSYYKKGGVQLALFPLAMRMAGPREALWHAIIRKNYGASHFIVGRDHAGCKSAAGEDFYGAYDAQDLVAKFKEEIGITILGFKALAYVPSLDKYVPKDEVPEGVKTLSISGTKFRKMMADGEDIPEWFSHPDVIKILREVSPPLDKRGFNVFFTGLSGSGKTTITTALIQTLQSLLPTRRMTVLDGDVVRTHLSSNLGFSIEDRNTNVARMGWVGAEVVRHGGIAICSTISPFHQARAESRAYAEATGGGFILVHISTSVEECAKRDVKGLYAKAKEGSIALTGVSHPYEYPDKAELTIDAGVVPVEKSVDFIVQYLVHRGYILPEGLPAKYNTAPEIALKAAGVLTDAVTDPASKLCPGPTAPRVSALVALGSSAESYLNAVATTRDFEKRALSTADLVANEHKTSADTPAEFMVSATSLTEAQSVQAGWDAYYPAKKELSDKSIVISNPRLLHYGATMLRADPCLRIVVIKPTKSVQEALLAEEGITKAQMNEFFAHADHLKQLFPDRVGIGSTHDTPAAVAKWF